MSIYENKNWNYSKRENRKNNNVNFNDKKENRNKNNGNDFSRVSGKKLTNPRKSSSRSDGRVIENDINKTGNSVFTRNTVDKDSMEDERTLLKKFCSDIIHFKSDIRSVKETITESFVDVCKIMRNFFSSKYDGLSKEMNDTFDLMSTEFFCSALHSAIKSDSIDLYNNRTDIGITLATLVTTSSEKMHTRTVNTYVYNILNTDDVFGPIISELMQKTGITEYLALDLCIAIPMDPAEMTDKDIQQYYGKFLNIILEHSDDNIDVLDYNTLNKMMSYMFGGNVKGSPAIKVIGRLLAEPRIAVDSETKAAVYDEFIKMLYTRLDMCDIKDIVFVLKFVFNTIDKDDDKVTHIFDMEDASKYDEIVKAISIINDEAESDNDEPTN